MNIVICGAGEVGTHVADVLATAGNDITVIDLDAERLRAISDNMDVGTLVGNGASAEVLREAGAEDADLMVAATNSDEINLLCASIAKGVGTQRTIARVHRSAFFEKRGLDYQAHFKIDHLICPEFATATAIARTMRNPAALAIEHFARGKIEMQALSVTEGAPALGRPLYNVRLPRGTRIGAVVRGADVFIPDANTVVQTGDNIVLIANADIFNEARRLFHKGDVGRRSVVIMGGAGDGGVALPRPAGPKLVHSPVRDRPRSRARACREARLGHRAERRRHRPQRVRGRADRPGRCVRGAAER